MKYKTVVAYIPDTSVLFELDDGRFALVSYNEITQKSLVTVTEFAESHLKFGGFLDGGDIPEEMLNMAVDILEGER